LVGLIKRCWGAAVAERPSVDGVVEELTALLAKLEVAS
jgi:hypothetical protein